jgi:CRP-like cAMP-binding protein
MTENLASALITKLTVSNHLDGNDIRAIQGLPIREKRVRAGHVIVADGERPNHCCLLASGFAFRSKTTMDGQRQVLSIHIPGEIPDLQSLHLNVTDHDLVALSSCTLGLIAHGDLREMNRQRPNLAAALWRETLIDVAIFREWIVNVGRREAVPRMSHLLMEIHKRLKAVGQARDGEFGLPITQTHLSDCLGLSVVHTNRVLQYLRKEGLISAHRSEYQILQPERLERLAAFDSTYLHLSPAS